MIFGAHFFKIYENAELIFEISVSTLYFVLSAFRSILKTLIFFHIFAPNFLPFFAVLTPQNVKIFKN